MPRLSLLSPALVLGAALLMGCNAPSGAERAEDARARDGGLYDSPQSATPAVLAGQNGPTPRTDEPESLMPVPGFPAANETPPPPLQCRPGTVSSRLVDLRLLSDRWSGSLPDSVAQGALDCFTNANGLAREDWQSPSSEICSALRDCAADRSACNLEAARTCAVEVHRNRGAEAPEATDPSASAEAAPAPEAAPADAAGAPSPASPGGDPPADPPGDALPETAPPAPAADPGGPPDPAPMPPERREPGGTQPAPTDPEVPPAPVVPPYVPPAPAAGDRVYVVERLDCSTGQGDWVVFSEGTLESLDDDGGRVAILDRYGLRYRPEEEGEDFTNWWCLPRRQICASSIGFADFSPEWQKGDTISADAADILYAEDGITLAFRSFLDGRCR